MFKDAPVLESQLDLPLIHRGKVRDVYEVDDNTLLMVASDRVSAFDVVLPQPIPNKGEVLTQITAWWLKQLENHLEHHLIAVDPDTIVTRHPELAGTRPMWEKTVDAGYPHNTSTRRVHYQRVYHRFSMEGVPGKWNLG